MSAAFGPGMISRTHSAWLCGIEGRAVEVQAAFEPGVPRISVTGLAGSVIRESCDRVRVCLGRHGFSVPTGRIMVHLHPADAPKQGSQLDLAIAFAALGAEQAVSPAALGRFGFLGELTLDGRVRGVTGALALADALEKCAKLETVLVPRENAEEVALLESPKVRVVESLGQILDFLRGAGPALPEPRRSRRQGGDTGPFSLDRVRGQTLAKRALEVALAGRHSLLLVGPPGVGKSMLAETAATLLPPLSREEAIDVGKSRVYCGGDFVPGARPFRSPHHTIPAAGLLGGGSGRVVPGEVTLAHHGVLFLDEFPEFRKDALEGLREPLESGVIHVHRGPQAMALPARFSLIAAMNPCPCGYALGGPRRCRCRPDQVASYQKRLSGPILDRLDLCVLMETETTTAREVSGTQERVRGRIAQAWERQCRRYGEARLRNGDLSAVGANGKLLTTKEAEAWLEALVRSEGLNHRTRFRLLKVGRTIADLEAREVATVEDLRLAWSLRCPDLFRGAFGH